MRFAVLLVTLLSTGVALAGQNDSPARRLENTVAQATRYVQGFVSRFSHVVTEEHYEQEWRPPSGPARRSQWVADFLLVRTGEDSGWMPFRDVFEINKTEVRDRTERLTALFLESSGAAKSQVDAINEEAARYNIGPKRTVNHPLLALAFLQDGYRTRFQFSLEGRDRIEGRNADVIGFRETSIPSLIRGSGGAELPSHGRFWIDQQDGSVLKTELLVEDAIQKCKIVVEFQRDDRFQLWTPRSMQENYDVRRSGTTRATAKYGRFRSFQVNTTEQFEAGKRKSP